MYNLSSIPAQKYTGHPAEMLQIGQYTKTVTYCNNANPIVCKSNHCDNEAVTDM